MITLSPTSGPVGSYVTASGKGFQRKESGAIEFGVLRVGTFRCSASGSFSTTFRVPDLAPGMYNVAFITPNGTTRTNYTILGVVTPPPPPPPPLPPPGTFPVPSLGVLVKAGSSLSVIQALIDTNPADSIFLWEAGTYDFAGGFILPKSGNKHYSVASRGAVIINGGVLGYGGESGQHDILVQGFVMSFARQRPLKCGWRWILNDIEAHHSNIGVELNNGCRVNGGRWHDNDQYGFNGGPGTDIVIDGLENDHNNPSQIQDGDHGGMKIVGSSTGFTLGVMKNCHVHHNGAHGVWFDWANKDITYDSNYIHDNGGAGIFHEASDKALIINNRVENNMVNIDPTKSLWYGAEIFLNDSSNVEICNNQVIARLHGIGAIDTDRGSTLYGLLQVANLNVHDNFVHLLSTNGRNGLGGQRPPASTNHFVSNHYEVPDLSMARWVWGVDKTWAEWRSLNQDISGSVV